MEDQTIPTIAAKGIPPAVVGTLNAVGFTVPDLINVLTVFWLVALCIQMAWRGYKFVRDKGYLK